MKFPYGNHAVVLGDQEAVSISNNNEV